MKLSGTHSDLLKVIAECVVCMQGAIKFACAHHTVNLASLSMPAYRRSSTMSAWPFVKAFVSAELPYLEKVEEE